MSLTRKANLEGLHKHRGGRSDAQACVAMDRRIIHRSQFRLTQIIQYTAQIIQHSAQIIQSRTAADHRAQLLRQVQL
jgi:hypothetical protein